MRTYSCSRCHREFPAEGKTGRLPDICHLCDPEAASRRAFNRVRDTKLRLTQDLLWHFSNSSLVQTPGKPAIVAGVKALNAARGPKATRVALLRLAGACLAWCLDLTPEVQEEKKRLDVQTRAQISQAENEAVQGAG